MAAPIAQYSLLPSSVHRQSLAVPIKVVLVALGAGLTAVSAQFTLAMPFTAVPFTFTPMAVLLVGAALGARLGAAAQVTYVVTGALGFAVFSPSATLPPGFLRLVGPTGGYLLSYPLAAFVTGLLAERGWDRRYLTSVAAMLVGLVIIYAGGVGWLAAAYTGSLPTAIAAGATGFLVLDVLKILCAGLVLPSAWKLVGRE